MASILSFATRVFRTRDPGRDAATDMDRLMPVRAAIVAAIESAARERGGLRQRVDDYYAAASHLLDQAAFNERPPEDERAIAEAESHGSAGLRRVAAIDRQLERLNRVLDFVDEQETNGPAERVVAG